MASIDGGVPPESSFPLESGNTGGHPGSNVVGEFNPSDTVLPTVVFNPVSGNSRTPSNTVIVDVVDAPSGGLGSGLRRVSILVVYTDGTTELAYSGSGFVTPYSAGSSTSVIGNGTRFTLQRSGDGWLDDFQLRVYAVDTSGNEPAANPTVASYTVPLGIGTTDTLEPDLSIAPVGGDDVLEPDEVVIIEATDVFGVADVVIWVEYTPSGVMEIVYIDGDEVGAHNVDVTSISGGFQYAVSRGGDGWLEAHRINVQAVDTSGNLASTSYDVTVPDGVGAGTVDAIEPTVTVISPAEGEDITPDTELIVDVEDEDELALVILLVTFAGWGHTEAIYNGTAFLPPYTGGGSVPSSSVETLVAGQHLRFHLRRFGGWPGAVSLYLAPVDRGGNLPAA